MTEAVTSYDPGPGNVALTIWPQPPAVWGIPNPSFGPAETEDNGSLEFLLNFTHA